MQAPSSPPWMTGYSPRRGSRHADPGMRVSDAERAEVADRLSRHYADGRLDQAEFDERMSRAMNARTHGDFAGLFADLPDLPDQRAQGGQASQPGPLGPQGGALNACGSRGRRRRGLGRIVMLALVAVAAILAAHVVVHWFVPWVLIAVLAFLLLRDGGRRRRRI